MTANNPDPGELIEVIRRLRQAVTDIDYRMHTDPDQFKEEFRSDHRIAWVANRFTEAASALEQQVAETNRLRKLLEQVSDYWAAPEHHRDDCPDRVTCIDCDLCERINAALEKP